MHVGNIAPNKTDKNSCLKGPSISEEEIDQKRKKDEFNRIYQMVLNFS